MIKISKFNIYYVYKFLGYISLKRNSIHHQTYFNLIAKFMHYIRETPWMARNALIRQVLGSNIIKSDPRKVKLLTQEWNERNCLVSTRIIIIITNDTQISRVVLIVGLGHYEIVQV